MPYFKDAGNGLHYLSENDIANGGLALLPADCAEISDLDAAAIQNPPPTLDKAQAAQISLIYEAYNTAIAKNVAYTSKGGIAQTFQADETSMTYVNRMLSAYSSTGATPSDFYWVAADNTKVPFTYADLQGLAAAMGDQGWAAFQKLQGLKAQINAVAVSFTQSEGQAVAAVQAIAWG